jgi:hypothetical protein
MKNMEKSNLPNFMEKIAGGLRAKERGFAVFRAKKKKP